MAFASNSPFIAARLGAILLAGILAGCQGGTSALNMGGSSGQTAQADATDDRITADELRAYCPRVVLRSGTAFYNTYERGGDGDPSKVVYQASISDVTRSCTYQPGTLTMTVAAAGRVIPGPAGTSGTITMPIRIAVTRGEEVLYSQLHQYQVQIDASRGATQFVFNDPNVVIPSPDARNILVQVGYDEGPQGAR